VDAPPDPTPAAAAPDHTADELSVPLGSESVYDVCKFNFAISKDENAACEVLRLGKWDRMLGHSHACVMRFT